MKLVAIAVRTPGAVLVPEPGPSWWFSASGVPGHWRVPKRKPHPGVCGLQSPTAEVLVTFPGFVLILVLEASEGSVSNLELFEKMFAIQATDEGPVSRTETEPLHIKHRIPQ